MATQLIQPPKAARPLAAGRRFRFRAIVALALAATLAAVLAAFSPGLRSLIGWRVTAGEVDLSAPVSRAEARALLAATRGPAAAIVATGDQALMANAALPFSTAPILAASPFSIARAAAGDQQRALHCLTQAVYFEAGYEPLEGRRAVAQVVLNRMRHPAFPKSVCGVVYEGSHQRVCQFSFTCDGSLARTPARGSWEAARLVAQQALAGTVNNAVGMATHYHTDYVSPYWAPKLTKLVQVGAHIFYRWPGGWGMPGAFGGRYAGFEAIPSANLATASLVPTEIADALAKLPPERRAENDLGGRLDVTKGWVLKIPDPAETRGAYSAATLGQTTTAVSSAEKPEANDGG